MSEPEFYARGFFTEYDGPPTRGRIADRFTLPPFTILNAREGFWQGRKRIWLALGIRSELGRGEAVTFGIAPDGTGTGQNSSMAYTDLGKRVKKYRATPGNSPLPAADYSKRERGTGAGRAIKGSSADAKTYGSGGPGTLGNGYKKKRRQKLPPGGGGGGCWLGGPKTSSSENFDKKKARAYGDHAWLESKGMSNRPGAKKRKASEAKPPHPPTVTRNKDGTLNYGGTKHQAERFDQQRQTDDGATGTSIFDPVLTELAYRWFCPPGGRILDPFAGGSVRGIVASCLGRRYTGIDLRPEQIASNRAQRAAICTENLPKWIVGDSCNIPKMKLPLYDFVFSCPPYGDLEQYSDDPRDLSAQSSGDFRFSYQKIITAACSRLRNNRFACFVVGDYRDKAGNYMDFVSTTIRCFRKAGLHLYNEAILITAVGSLPIRIAKQFERSRKMGKTHQNVLCFVKGSGKIAAAACGELG